MAPQTRPRAPGTLARREERVFEDICERLTAGAELDASDIEVAIANAEVTLGGSVPDRWSKRRAEDIALAVAGVVDVHNRLRLRARTG